MLLSTLSTCCAWLVTLGGSRPRSPSASRSASVKLVPLLSRGSCRRATPWLPCSLVWIVTTISPKRRWTSVCWSLLYYRTTGEFLSGNCFRLLPLPPTAQAPVCGREQCDYIVFTHRRHR